MKAGAEGFVAIPTLSLAGAIGLAALVFQILYILFSYSFTHNFNLLCICLPE